MGEKKMSPGSRNAPRRETEGKKKVTDKTELYDFD